MTGDVTATNRSAQTVSIELPEATTKLLNLAERLSGKTPESGAFMLLVAAACLTCDRATFFEAAERAFAVVHEPVEGELLQ